MDFTAIFYRNIRIFFFIKSKFSSVLIKISRVEMDSTPLNCIGAPQLSKFDNYIMDFQNFRLIFCWISLKTSRKISPFRLMIRLHLIFILIFYFNSLIYYSSWSNLYFIKLAVNTFYFLLIFI